MRHIVTLVYCLYFSLITFSQTSVNPLASYHLEAQNVWVDAKYNAMTLEEKVGQLYMVQVMSNQSQALKDKLVDLIKTHHIGGIIYSLGTPEKQAILNNELQLLSKIPLLIGMDAEWGLSMRLDNTYAFPWNMTLGAIADNNLIEQTGKQIGEHCKRLGVHFNFGPVVDINTNPKNPIIGNRSFGEDRDNVTKKSLAFMKGMQGAGVLASAKHFPGHGDTDQDSHKVLPTISFNEKRIDSIELYPYKKLINECLASVMVAHLQVPSLEPSGMPSSLSQKIVTNLLKEKLGFQGLIFTDALTMKGAANFKEVGAIDLAAFQAGNDVMLMSEDVSIGVSKIMEAYNNGTISEARLALSVKKILQAKYKVGLNNYEPINLDKLSTDLNRLQDDILYEELLESAITVVKNDEDLLPLRRLDEQKIAYVKMGDDDGSVFLNELKKYTKVHEIEGNTIDSLLINLQDYNTIVVGLHRSNQNPWKSYQFTATELEWIQEIANKHKVVLDVFVKPYALSDLKSIENIESIVVSYQNSKIAQEKSAQLVFGAIASKGTLPVSVANYFEVGEGIQNNAIMTLGYTVPERVGVNSEKLNKIDLIAKKAIDGNMTPGIQVLVARKGKVIYNKNFGKHTYEGNESVAWDDIYDVASLTKILATLPLLMELEEQGKVSIDTKLSQILPSYKKSNKAKITLKAMLSHYARLKPWEPFYVRTLDSVTKRPSEKYYRKERSEKFNIEIDNELFLRSDYPDSIQKIIKDSDLLSKTQYRYSDFPYFILKEYIEDYYDSTLDVLVQDHFYKSLGANNTMYNPYHKVSNKKIVPTEVESYFRFGEVKGFVHDMAAAMQNGVGGHAGIFSNANDVAKIMQMFLQKGYYGGKRYFKPETIDTFNTCYYCEQGNRRGIGFDKPQLGEAGPTCGCVSMTSFGHSGFTGAYTWADPEEEIVYVFMANRTYPDSTQNLLLKENIRTDIQNLIYEAIVK